MDFWSFATSIVESATIWLDSNGKWIKQGKYRVCTDGRTKLSVSQDDEHVHVEFDRPLKVSYSAIGFLHTEIGSIKAARATEGKREALFDGPGSLFDGWREV